MPSKTPKTRQRYSIGEWYGRPFELMSPDERREQAKLELAGGSEARCRFQKDKFCKKRGGVCTLRKYEQTGSSPVVPVGPLVTVCPNRFAEDQLIYRWIGERLLNTSDPLILGQIPFLHRLRSSNGEKTTEIDEKSRDFIGRIDNVLVHRSQRPIDWCAVELQAVYFSGKAMTNEYKLLAEENLRQLPFPAENHRPDWRSSGPKRLLPQLQTKVPTISIWGKKVAVVIDEAFFASLVGLQRERHLSNAQLVWFVVGYDLIDNLWRLKPREVVFSKLDSAVTALTGGVPLPRDRFEAQVHSKISLTYPNHKFA